MSKIIVIRFPQVCSSFSNPRITKIHVYPGCIVKRNSDLFEIESDKGILVLQSEFSGIITNILVKEEDFLKENDTLVTILKD